jgi:hypothetical protein
MKIMMKLVTNAKIEGITCVIASQKSAMLLIVTDDGILISMMSNVRAIAKTPSQKASKRELGFVSAIFYF